MQPGEKENGFVVGATYPPHSGFLKEPEPVYNEETGGYEFSDDYPEEVVEQVCEQWGATVNYGDAEFIARARTRWPAALDEIDRLRKENELLGARVAELEPQLQRVGDAAVNSPVHLAEQQGQGEPCAVSCDYFHCDSLLPRCGKSGKCFPTAVACPIAGLGMSEPPRVDHPCEECGSEAENTLRSGIHVCEECMPHWTNPEDEIMEWRPTNQGHQSL